MKILRVGLAGLGHVGGGVAELLHTQSELLAARAGCAVKLVAASVRNPDRVRHLPLKDVRLMGDPRQLAAQDDLDVIVEAIGGSEGMALEVVRAALEAGKSVVTCNKALLAVHGLELAKLAEAKGVSLLWEAAVGGGIPVIKGIREGMSSSCINEVRGILNGTCNFILSTMTETGREFEDVLKEAQELGFAEADPSVDIDGIDAAHKLSLLSALAFGCVPNPALVQASGIRQIGAHDIKFADEMGYAIKLVAIARRTPEGLDQRVQACMVLKNSAFGSIGGPYNAIIVRSDYAGDMMWTGRGAGGRPTASAVVSDLVDIARGNHTLTFGLPAAQLEALQNPPTHQYNGSYYVRLLVNDEPGVVAGISAVLKEHQVSMKAFLQHSCHCGKGVPLAFTTHNVGEASMMAALEGIKKFSSINEPPRLIRVLDSD